MYIGPDSLVSISYDWCAFSSGLAVEVLGVVLLKGTDIVIVIVVVVVVVVVAADISSSSCCCSSGSSYCIVKEVHIFNMHCLHRRHTALLERDITRALQHPDRLNPHMNDAVEARREVISLCLCVYMCMIVYNGKY